MENEVNEPALKYNYTSAEEYLAMERASEEKHELHQGRIVAMSGASKEHNKIFANLFTAIGSYLDGTSCHPYGSDFRVKVPTADTFTYPDIIIVCDEDELMDEKFDTLKNPSVIIEILSRTTEKYDRERKFFYYMQIPSFKEYIMVSSMEIYIQTALKQDDSLWKFDEIKDLDSSLLIKTTQQTIPLKKIYQDVKF